MRVLAGRWALAVLTGLARVAPAAAQVTVLHSFAGGPGEPANPGGLTTDGSTLYGISGAGGANNLGTIYSVPIPEPSSFLLAAGGALALLARGGAPNHPAAALHRLGVSVVRA